MSVRHTVGIRQTIAAAALLALLTLPALAGYRYNLADFTGPVRPAGAHLQVDRHHDEVYLLHGNEVRIFNETGMEIYRFLADPELGVILDLVVEPSGDLLVLSSGLDRDFGLEGRVLTRCDYRGRPLQTIARQGWPDALAGMGVDRVFLRGDELVFLNVQEMRVVEAAKDGSFLRDLDLGALLGIDEADRASVQISGVAMDPQGRLLLSVAVMFKVFRVSADGHVEAFGKGGSAPGLFGNISGVAGDEAGRVYVADKLRHVVMIFDEQLRFVREFGYAGNRPGNLRGPGELAVDARGLVYVTQRGGRGISVFSVSSD
jgi:hypothetical protein